MRVLCTCYAVNVYVIKDNAQYFLLAFFILLHCTKLELDINRMTCIRGAFSKFHDYFFKNTPVASRKMFLSLFNVICQFTQRSQRFTSRHE